MDFRLSPVSTSTNAAFSLALYMSANFRKGRQHMNYINTFSDLTLNERHIILTGLMNGFTKTAIAQT